MADQPTPVSPPRHLQGLLAPQAMHPVRDHQVPDSIANAVSRQPHYESMQAPFVNAIQAHFQTCSQMIRSLNFVESMIVQQRVAQLASAIRDNQISLPFI